MKTHLTKKAGEFKAFCRKFEWVTADRLGDVDPNATENRWDKKLRATVFLTQCAFETTDPALYVAHMTEQHDGGVYRWENGGLDSTARLVKTHRARMPLPVKLWRGPKLTQDGAPWPEKDERTRICATCGMVFEGTSLAASVMYFAEHERGCAIAKAGAVA